MNAQTPDTQGGRPGAPARWKSILGVGAALLLLGGAAWRSGLAQDATLSAESAQSAPVHAAQSTPTITHAVAGARDSYADIVKAVAPAVVTVRAEGRAAPQQTQMMPDSDLFRRFFGDEFDGRMPRMPRQGRSRAIGSGVIVSTDGYILTNNHIIDNARDTVEVDLTDGRTLKATIVGADKPSDLALLKVQASDLHPIALGNSEAVQVGDVALAIGNPLNLGQTVTMGIISAKGRATSAGDGSYEDFLQTDAPINHGNSGGALVNTKGELIGITSQILSPSDGNIGIGFAIPVNMARGVMDQLKTGGKVHRSQLGVTVQPMTNDLAASLGLKNNGGVIVNSVVPDSAADKAGLKRGDVILSFNGTPVHDTNNLRNRVAESKPGTGASVVIARDGHEQTVKVNLAEAQEARNGRSASSDDSTADNSGAALGITVSPVSPDTPRRSERGMRGERSERPNVSGLMVEDVDPNGRAADAGIQPGDVITEVNKQPVRTVEELKSAVHTKSDKPLLFLINRDGQNIFVTVKPSNS